jgi:hypothetical protein
MTYDSFEEFLERNGTTLVIYEQHVIAGGDQEELQKFNSMKRNNEAKDIELNSAFAWSDTREGHNFWEELDRSWFDIFSKDNDIKLFHVDDKINLNNIFKQDVKYNEELI